MRVEMPYHHALGADVDGHLDGTVIGTDTEGSPFCEIARGTSQPGTVPTQLYDRCHADIGLDDVERIHHQTGARIGMSIPPDQVATHAAQTRRPASANGLAGLKPSRDKT